MSLLSLVLRVFAVINESLCLDSLSLIVSFWGRLCLGSRLWGSGDWDRKRSQVSSGTMTWVWSLETGKSRLGDWATASAAVKTHYWFPPSCLCKVFPKQSVCCRGGQVISNQRPWRHILWPPCLCFMIHDMIRAMGKSMGGRGKESRLTSWSW